MREPIYGSLMADALLFRKLDLRSGSDSSMVRRGLTHHNTMLKVVNTHRLFPISSRPAGAVPCWKALATGYESDSSTALARRCAR